MRITEELKKKKERWLLNYALKQRRIYITQWIEGDSILNNLSCEHHHTVLWLTVWLLCLDCRVH